MAPSQNPHDANPSLLVPPVDENSTQEELAAAFQAASAAELRAKPQLPYVPLVVCVMGAPGSGKTTQSEVITEAFRCRRFDAEEMVREDLARPVGSKYRSFFHGWRAQGLLSEEEMAMIAETQEVKEALAEACVKVDHESMFVLDGFPTSIRRLEYFEEWAYSVNLIIWLNAPPSNDDLKQRLMARGDDSEWMIDQSLQEWDEEPLLAYLKRDWASNERNLFMVHGGSGSVEEVAAEVRRAVTSFMQQQLGKEKYKEQMDRTQRDLVTAERAHG